MRAPITLQRKTLSQNREVIFRALLTTYSFKPIRLSTKTDGGEFELLVKYQQIDDDDRPIQIIVDGLYNRHGVPDEVRAVLAAGKLPASKRPSCYPPQSYRNYIEGLHRAMDDLATRLFNILRWRCGITGGKQFLSSGLSMLRWSDDTSREEFNEDGLLPNHVPYIDLLLDASFLIRVSVDEYNDHHLVSLIDNDVHQPLYHDMYREAWRSRLSSPRSAIAIGMAAAEIAVKMFVSDRVPLAGWLVEEIPSPPWVMMVWKYLEQLPAENTFNGKVKRPPNEMISILSKGVEQRNKLLHGKKDEVPAEDVLKTLIAVRDLLYLLDYYRGHDWALEHISPERLAELQKQ